MSNVLARARVVIEGDMARLYTALAQAESTLERSGRRMEEIGREVSMRITLPLMAMGGAAVHAAAQFDHTLRKTAALTALTKEQTFGLSDAVRDMGITYAASAKEAADGLLFIATPSLTIAQTMDVLRESLKAAAIGLGDVKTISLGAVGAMNAYAKSGMTATRAVEILTAGVKFGRFEASELIPVLSRLTGIASALGIAFEDVVGVLSVLTLTGSNTYEASTQLSAIMSTLMGTSQEGERILRSFGLSLKSLRDTAAKPGGLIQVFREINAAVGGNVEQLEAVFPNIRALRGVMNALAQDSALVDRAMRGVRNSTGVLDKAFGIFAEGPAHLMKLALATVKDSLVELGNLVIPLVVPLLQKLAEAVRKATMWFSALPKDIQRLMLVSAGLAMTLGPLIFVFGAIARVMSIFRFSFVIAGFSAIGSVFSSLIGVLKGSTILFSIKAAFGAAALAGTGFKGVVAGLVPTFKLAFAAMAPFVSGLVIVGGLGLIVAKWIEMEIAVAQVNSALKETKTRHDQVLGKLSKQQAAASWTRLALIVQDLQKRIKDLSAEEQKNQRQANEVAARGGLATSFLNAANAARTQRLELEENVKAYREQLKVLGQVITKQEEASVVTQQGEGTPRPNREPPWLLAAEDAVKAYEAALKNASRMQELFGKEFDNNEAQAQALTDAVNALVEAGIPLDTVIGQSGHSLRSLANDLIQVQGNIDKTKEAEEALEAVLRLAQEAVEDAKTPFDQYVETMEALRTAFDLGKISLEEYIRAIEHAKKTAEESTEKVSDLSRAMTDLTKDAVSDFVDAIFDAKTNWHEFFHQMMKDIAALIIKMYILKALFPKDKGPGGVIGELLGFAKGGFLAAGGIGIVGERGPELVMAGRSGMTISPMPAMAAAGGGGELGGMMKVEINVNAIDSRGVQQFFEENEGHVAGAMMRAARKSSMLRRRLGG